MLPAISGHTERSISQHFNYVVSHTLAEYMMKTEYADYN
jgi:hypothetical protein